MKKKVFHKVDSGSFKRDDTKFDYIVEQDMNKDPMKTGNVRVRVVKKKPVVKAVRTRYDPHIEVDGDPGAYVPSLWGYNLKEMKRYIFIFPLLFVVPFGLILVPRLIDGLSGIISVEITSKIVEIGLKVGFFGLVAYMIFAAYIPMLVRYFVTIKDYFWVKKHGRMYNQKEEMLDEIAPRN